MQNTRTSNSKRNIITGVIGKIVGIILPFINRTAILYILGAEYQGLSSLFTSILSVFNVMELGIGSAIVYLMYKPIVDNNNKMINSLLNFFKKTYIIIGIVILILGIIVLPFLNVFINGDINIDINIYILYAIYLFNSVSSYFFFAYRSTILKAYQRSDIINTVQMWIKIIECIVQFIILIIFKNYYLYILIIPIFSTLLNLIIAMKAKKIYPQHNPDGNIDCITKKELKKHVTGLIINKFGDIARNSFDSIIISSMLGLTMVAVYSNYYYIYSSLYGILLIITHSIMASVGNSIANESKLKNYNDFIKFNFIFTWITGFISICMLCLYQPFMELWVGTELMLSNFDMILFCLYFYLITANCIRNTYFSGNGLWWKAKVDFIVEAILNLLLNFVLGYSFGVTGILLATIITILVFNFIRRTQILYKYYFTEFNINKFWKETTIYFVATILNASICYYISSLINLSLILKLITIVCICCILPNVIYFIIYRKREIFKTSFKWSLKIIKKGVK